MNRRIWSSLPAALLATVLGTTSSSHAQSTNAVDQNNDANIIPAQMRHKPVRPLPFATRYPVTEQPIALAAASIPSSVQPTDVAKMGEDLFQTATGVYEAILAKIQPEERAGDRTPESSIQRLSQSPQLSQTAFNCQKRGMASWYGPQFQGTRTASGEIFNQHSMTAAHRSLPFGTRVRVTNLNNKRSVVVRINNRGPFIGGRVIDLSTGAASVLGVTKTGVAPVRLDVLGR
jgi:rare lipoprotein A (peptidoglycan hydrolase)